MITVPTPRRRHKNAFDSVADPFIQSDGLPFSDVLNAEWIQRVFREENGLFGQDDIFSTQIVLWAFLAQTLRDGKGAACAAAVADIATCLLQTGQQAGSSLWHHIFTRCGLISAFSRMRPTVRELIERTRSADMTAMASVAWSHKTR